MPFGTYPTDWKIMKRAEIVQRLKLLCKLLQDRDDWEHLMTVIIISFNLTEEDSIKIMGPRHHGAA